MIKQIFLLLAATVAAGICLWGQVSSSAQAAWNRPVKPFRMIGNVYYVGAAGVSSFLVNTGEGLVLIDGGFAETAPQIERNVAALGFHMKDVKYLLSSHAHYDHCGGLAALKRASGAQLVASRRDSQALITGHQLSYGPGQGEAHFPRVKVDRVIDDGALVSLGNTTLTAHLTPGHTPGCTTWTMPVKANGKTYQAAIDCSTTVAGNQLVDNSKYPQIVSDYRHSFALLSALPCDVFLAPHPWFFDLEDKRKQLDAGKKDAFVDPSELRRFVQESEQDFDKELQRQEAAHHS